MERVVTNYATDPDLTQAIGERCLPHIEAALAANPDHEALYVQVDPYRALFRVMGLYADGTRTLGLVPAADIGARIEVAVTLDPDPRRNP